VIVPRKNPKLIELDFDHIVIIMVVSAELEQVSLIKDILF
jgi:hypothetical protein